MAIEIITFPQQVGPRESQPTDEISAFLQEREDEKTFAARMLQDLAPEDQDRALRAYDEAVNPNYSLANKALAVLQVLEHDSQV